MGMNDHVQPYSIVILQVVVHLISRSQVCDSVRCTALLHRFGFSPFNHVQYCLGFVRVAING